MKKQLTQLEEFHTAFRDANEQKPTLLSTKQTLLRFKLLKEENEEYFQVCTKGDMVEIADALGDQLYILFGTIYKHGMSNIIEEVFDRIHASNMTKLDENGNPIVNGENGVFDESKPVGKFLKPTSYKPVDLTDLFNDVKS